MHDPGEAVEIVCRFLGEGLAASGFTEGCPLATVGLEATNESELVRTTIAKHYEGWTERIGARLVAAGVDAESARKMATFALATIEGALLLSKVARSPAPLFEAGAMLRALVAVLPGR